MPNDVRLAPGPEYGQTFTFRQDPPDPFFTTDYRRNPGAPAVNPSLVSGLGVCGKPLLPPIPLITSCGNTRGPGMNVLQNNPADLVFHLVSPVKMHIFRDIRDRPEIDIL